MADTNLLDTLGKAPMTFVALTTGLYTLARIAQVLHGLNVSDRTWHRIRRELKNVAWHTLMVGLVYLVVFLHYGNLNFKWPLTVLLLPGIWSTLLMGNVPLEERETLPTWLNAAAVTAWMYTALAGVGLLGLWIYADVKGAKESCRLQSGGTLVGAVAENNARCVSFWLQRGEAGPALVGEPSPLYRATAGGNVQMLDLLLNSGHFDPNLPTADGDTPLHVAVRNGHPDMVCRLLAHGALSHVPNRDFITPLDLARDLSDQSLVTLIESGTCLPAE